jgi:hypothetical protein
MPASAQDAALKQDAALAKDVTFSKAELDQMLAPIALYPDDLLSNVLIAATYPLEVVQAARWIEEPAHAKLEGDALTAALKDQDWDPSVKSLTQFPDVLAMMSEQLEWTQKLGDAFLANEADVMDRIQFLRDKAEEAGNLASNKHQKVTTRRSGGTEYIYIEPADPDVVYVPVYEPTVVYGSWWYPDYPPYYWGSTDIVYEDDFYWGAGVTILPRYWGWCAPRWGGHYIHVNVSKHNRISGQRRKVRSSRWQHDAYHRRGVEYRNIRARSRYEQTKGDGRRRQFDYRDHDGKQVLVPGKDRRREARRNDGGQLEGDGSPRRDANSAKVRDRKTGDRPRTSKRSGPDKRASAGPKKRRDNANVKKRSNRAAKRFSSGGEKRSATRASKRRSSAGVRKQRRSRASSMVRNRSSVRRSSSRGRSSFGARRGGGHNAGARGGGRSAGMRGGGRGGGGGGGRGGGGVRR